MKHWKNHRKDRFFQQCGGPTSEHAGEVHLSEEQELRNSMKSMLAVLKSEQDFPICIMLHLKSGTWEVVPHNNLFGMKVESRERLVEFAEKYVYADAAEWHWDLFCGWIIEEAFKMNREQGDTREYTAADHESSELAVAGIFERNGARGCIDFLLNYRYTPPRKTVRGYC